jgi:hypothetical protein
MPAIDALQSAPDKAFEEGAPADFGLETLIETTRRRPKAGAPMAATASREVTVTAHPA